MQIEPFVLQAINQALLVRKSGGPLYLVNPSFVRDGREPAGIEDHDSLEGTIMRNSALRVLIEKESENEDEPEYLHIAEPDIEEIRTVPVNMHTHLEVIMPVTQRIKPFNANPLRRSFAVHTYWEGVYLFNIDHLKRDDCPSGTPIGSAELERMLEADGIHVVGGTANNLQLPGELVRCIYPVQVTMTAPFCFLVPDFYGTWNKPNP